MWGQVRDVRNFEYGSRYLLLRHCIRKCENPVRTSQEAHHISATEPNRLILCKILRFHGGDYEECRLMGCYAVWLLHELLFQGTHRFHNQSDKNRRARNNVNSNY
jgi:hypothetical protein